MSIVSCNLNDGLGPYIVEGGIGLCVSEKCRIQCRLAWRGSGGLLVIASSTPYKP